MQNMLLFTTISISSEYQEDVIYNTNDQQIIKDCDGCVYGSEGVIINMYFLHKEQFKTGVIMSQYLL
jgi:hypothetical protein